MISSPPSDTAVSTHPGIFFLGDSITFTGSIIE